jgi:uncharacterized lipoprotein YddW (UPF0748 family)
VLTSLRRAPFRASVPLLLVALSSLPAGARAQSYTGGARSSPPEPAGATARAEARALWVSRFEYRSAAGIARIMATAARANFNIVYFQVRGAADAFYRSDIEPCAMLLCGRLGGTPPYDPLEVAVREAHRHGLQLHAWLNALPGFPAGVGRICASLGESDPFRPRHLLLEHPEFIMRDRSGRQLPCPNGEEYLWLSPGYGEVRTRLARVAADVARRYEVDGIHLDRIRYPGPAWSYDYASLDAFGGAPERDPDAWNEFRTSLINATVRETYDSIVAVRPDLVLSAAVWGVYTDRWRWHTQGGLRQLFQDPVAWTRDGYLDVAVPMTYFRIKPEYCARADWACLLDDHLSLIQSGIGRHVYIGIDAAKGAPEIVRQIELARSRGAAGISIFSYSAADSVGLWRILERGVFAHPAAVPTMPWRAMLSRDSLTQDARQR